MNIIPNGYEVKSKNKSYFFMEGFWCSEDYKIISDNKSVKLSKLANEEIKEHNEKNYVKIGHEYIINEGKAVYIGNNRFSTKSGFINESIDNIKLTEAAGDDIPDGYYYTSSTGKTYYKKNGQWFNKDTKSPLNASSSISLNRAALQKIEQFNQTSPVKIGDTWTSNKNKTFTYVGGDRLISSDGKLVPSNMSQRIIQSMAQNNDDDDEPSPEQDSSTEQSQPSNETENVPEEQPVTQNDNSDDSDELRSLASKINQSPDARKIRILLGRGDKISLMAADIMLSGKKSETLSILKSLNNNNGN